MRGFAEKVRRPQGVASAGSAIPSRGWFRQDREVRAILHPPQIAGSSRPVVARLDATGGELQEERSRALQQGRDPDAPVKKPRDAFDEAMSKAGSEVPAPVPEKTVPGDLAQQFDVFRLRPYDLWLLPRVQDRMKTIAAETEARERENVKKFGGQVTHTEREMMNYWEQRFHDSVNYILTVRPFPFRGQTRRDPHRTKQEHLLKTLKAEEEKLVKAAPADLVEQVEALRRSLQEKWRQEVDIAIDQFLILASHEAQFITVNRREPAWQAVEIYGLPEHLEGTVPASAHPGLVAGEPVAPSVVTFIQAVQRESGVRAPASNYPGHEKSNAWVGHPDDIGKYSFDVHLGIAKNAEGFYEREPVIRYFLAVERASKATQNAWVAFYNDFEVARQVNQAVGKQRIYYSGGGGGGQFHHGPEPYLLHIHFNIMPFVLAGQYFAGKNQNMPRLDMGGGS